MLAHCKKQEITLFKFHLNFGNMQLQGEIILNLILLMECGIDLFFIRHEIAGAFVGTDEKYCRRQPVNTNMEYWFGNQVSSLRFFEYVFDNIICHKCDRVKI